MPIDEKMGVNEKRKYLKLVAPRRGWFGRAWTRCVRGA
mgnify:FL=1|jgi:hypothetical protein